MSCSNGCPASVVWFGSTLICNQINHILQTYMCHRLIRIYYVLEKVIGLRGYIKVIHQAAGMQLNLMQR